LIAKFRQGRFWAFAVRHYKTIAVLSVVVVAFFVLAALVQLAAVQLVEGKSVDESKTVNDARVSLIQLLGLIGLVGGFIYSARTFALTRSTQRADRLVKAIGHIGDQNSEAIRVGGVHSLRLLAMEDTQYWPVAEQILSALVRERARAGKPSTADMRAALMVLGDRPVSSSDLHHRPLDLRGAHLRGVNLVGANLEGVWLDGADLAGANLTDAVLKNATLKGADLEGATLSSANFTAANLSGARLKGANFYETMMMAADVTDSHLSGALNLQADQLKTTSGQPASYP
jgi:hypothetical protein